MTALPETSNGITGTRTKAETKRALTGRILRAAACAEVTVSGAEMRLALADLVDRDEPTDEQVIESLMRATLYRTRPKRQWRVGEAGWRTRS